MMKILIATGLYPPEIGGPATYAKMLEDELPVRGVEVMILPFGIVRQYPKGVRHLVFLWKLWRMSGQVDLVYALDPVSVGLPARLVAGLRRLPFWVRLGGDYAWEQGKIRFGIKDQLDDFHKNKKTWPVMVKGLAYVQSMVTSKADKVIVPSDYLKGIVLQWDGVSEDRIEVIYSALYPIPVADSRESLRKQLDYSYPTLVSAGRLVPWKGFSALVRVVAKLRDKYPAITLVIAGDGEERESLKALVNELDLSDNVRLVGRISKEALGATIKAGDVFVLNTAYEGLSHQLIEVMDLGTPIVTTLVGGNPELISEGVNGYLVDFDDEKKLLERILHLLEHAESRERLVQSARLRSKDFTKEAVIIKLMELLNPYVEK